MNWSNQFILQSGDLDSDYFPQPQNDLHQPSTITRDDLEPILYNEPQINDTFHFPDPRRESYDLIAEDHPGFDYSFLLQENQPEPSNSERTWEEEPMVGDGARSCSSMGSTGSKKSQKISKDDKRKRNTAASARFRIKKKMREKELQSTASEMTDKAESMKQRVQDLEREVKWLKALVVEKDDGRLQKLVEDMPTVSFAFPSPSNNLNNEDENPYH